MKTAKVGEETGKVLDALGVQVVVTGKCIGIGKPTCSNDAVFLCPECHERFMALGADVKRKRKKR